MLSSCSAWESKFRTTSTKPGILPLVSAWNFINRYFHFISLVLPSFICKFNKTDGLILCLQWCSLLFFFHGSSWFIKVNDLFTLSLSHLFQILVSKMVPYQSITLNHSLSNLIISSQRLITISVSLRTRTILPCLIIQVLNTRVWFLNAWYNPFHFCM